jgi:sialidase-1
VEEAIAAGKAPATQVWVSSSEDCGSTWSKPIDISPSARKPSWGWYGTGPGTGLYLGDARKGRLLIPAYHSEKGIYRAHCLFSDDHGATWQLGADAADHTSEPQVVVLGDRSLLMNARTIAGHGKNRTLMTSRDDGKTWTAAIGLTALPEYDCQGCLCRCLRSGSKGQWDLIFTQPVSPRRIGVHAWISEDEGKTWPHAQQLWNGPSAYSSLVRTQDGMVCALIECGKKDTHEQIAFVKFAPEWLKTRTAP